MSKFTVKNLNRFLLIKLPSAFLSGVRVSTIKENKATAIVKHRWINQNPFRSMYWATQGMAAELVTGILLMKKIDDSKRKISLLVVEQKGEFFKKATGRITFICDDGVLIDKALQEAIKTGEGTLIHLPSKAYDQENDLVSSFVFTWSVKLKSQ